MPGISDRFRNASAFARLLSIAKGRVMSENRIPPDSAGVCPPILNQLAPSTTVSPDARKLIATPEIS